MAISSSGPIVGLSETEIKRLTGWPSFRFTRYTSTGIGCVIRPLGLVASQNAASWAPESKSVTVNASTIQGSELSFVNKRFTEFAKINNLVLI